MKPLIVSIICLCTLGLKAQNADYTQYYFKNFPNSPSTATFLRYGDIQNSEFTGANSPQIPLYTFSEGSVKIPLTLDYVSGNGIKVADEATSVGLGWNIGLPTITQSVFGADDFDESSVVKNLKIDLHYQDTPWNASNYNGKYLESKEMAEPAGYIHSPQRGKYAYYYAAHNVLPVNGYFKLFYNGEQYDGSPDIFTINLFGDKIQFIITNHGDLNSINSTPIFTCLNNKGYKVTYSNTNFFTVTAPNGIKYEFGKCEKVTIFGVINRNYVLTKVTDINNNIVTLSYNEYKDVINFTPISNNLNYTVGYNTSSSVSCDGIPVYYSGQYSYASKANGAIGSNLYFPYLGSSSNNSYGIPLSSNYSSKQNYLLISSINSSSSVVNFNYDTRIDFPTGKLNSITIKSFTNTQPVKTINFNYDYFTSSDNTYGSTTLLANRNKNRLKLKSLSINQTENYNFEYYEDYTLPTKDSYAVDYWGYYNGANSNRTYFLNPSNFPIASQVPTVTDTNSGFYNNNEKNANLNYCTTGVLKKIIYPTKGSSEYIYELNASDNLFLNYVPNNVTQGKGLRLMKQINRDINNNVANQTVFSYQGGYSFNPLSLIKKYSSKFYSGSGVATNNGGINPVNGVYNTSVISMNSTNNYSGSPLSSGDFIGYNMVTKTEVDNNQNTKGKIVTEYKINPDIHFYFYDEQLPINMPSTQDEGIENGKVLSQTFYDSSDNKIKLITNNYNTVYSETYYGTTISGLSENLYVCGPDLGWVVDLEGIGHYPIFSKNSLLTNSYTNEYLNGKTFTTTQSYSYNSRNFITNENETYPDGTSKGVAKGYPTEWNIQRLIDNNIIGVPIYESRSTNLATKEFLTKYEDTNHLNPTSVIQTNQRINGSVTTTDTVVKYTEYDSKGNLLEYKNIADIPTTIIWGYNNTQPIIKIEGVKYNDVKALQVVLDAIAASNADAVDPSKEGDLLIAFSNLRANSSLSNYQITTYTYDPLIGVTTITSPNGLRELYKYDSANRLEKVMDMDGNILKEYKYNYKQ